MFIWNNHHHHYHLSHSSPVPRALPGPASRPQAPKQVPLGSHSQMRRPRLGASGGRGGQLRCAWLQGCALNHGSGLVTPHVTAENGPWIGPSQPHCFTEGKTEAPGGRGLCSGPHNGLVAQLQLGGRSPPWSCSQWPDLSQEPSTCTWMAVGRQGGGKLRFQPEVNIDMTLFTR